MSRYRSRPFDLVEEIALGFRESATATAYLPATPIAALRGRGAITEGGYVAGLYYQSVTEIWRRGAGLNQASCEAIYHRLIAGAVDEAAKRYLSDDVDRPTTADAAKAELARYERRLGCEHRSLVSIIIDGHWPRCLVAAVAGDAVFWPPQETVPMTLIGGVIRESDHRALAEISRAFRLLSEVDPTLRMKRASLAA